jgi:serine/threonine protein kinase
MYNFRIEDLPNKYFDEMNILSSFINTNFIQKLISSFHDYDNLYFVSKFYDEYIINYLNRFWNENQIQFFSACLIQSLLHLRKEKYIHRDIHFGNIVLDKDYYFNLIDFHITIEYNKKNNPKNNIVGSPELCAPEMISNNIYDYNSDYYRIGTMLYFIILINNFN